MEKRLDFTPMETEALGELLEEEFILFFLKGYFALFI